jgi:uncharacterized protein YcbK (DUF882 family)
MLDSKYFKRTEFECSCGCQFYAVDAELLRVLEDVREHFGKPVRITSGCRCEEHNKRIGGAPKSKHMQGIAVDIQVKDVDAHDVYKYLDDKYPNNYGLGDANSFTHVDVRPCRSRWSY